MTRDLDVGDIVRCRSTSYAEGLGVGGRTGVVMEPRSAHCLVFFAGLDVSYWIPAPALERSGSEHSSRAAELRLLSRVLKLLEATEVEVETATDEKVELVVNHGPVQLEKVLEVKAEIGPALERYEIHPGGMAFMTTQIGFRRDVSSSALR